MRSILIVDDEFGIAEIIADVLSAMDFSVSTAINGKAALAAIEHERPDVILLDVMMPVMSGPELLEKLRASEVYRDIPVIMMSAVGRESVSPEVHARIAGFLQKPFTYDQLMEALGRVPKR
ncbi:MAG: response regulator [Planctomycetota bacterium]